MLTEPSEQISSDNLTKKPFALDKPVRLIELFAGVGSQAMAFRDLGIPFEHYRVCEFDKFAIQSYNAIHGTHFEVSDIRDWTGGDLGIGDTDTHIYFLTYSFPCTDLSLAGKQKGMGKESGTRSGLLWEVERLLMETEILPQVLLMENVPQVHGEKNLADFVAWIEFLESKGYSNYYKDLNAKDFGIPQNRDRTFMVSLLGNFVYEFPKPQELKLCLADVLETEVDEEYFLSDEAVESLLLSNYSQNRDRIDAGGIANTICARDYKGPRCVELSEQADAGV